MHLSSSAEKHSRCCLLFWKQTVSWCVQNRSPCCSSWLLMNRWWWPPALLLSPAALSPNLQSTLPKTPYLGSLLRRTKNTSAHTLHVDCSHTCIHADLHRQKIQFSFPSALRGGPGMLRSTNRASWDLLTITSFSFTAVCILRTLDWSLWSSKH